MQSQGNYIRYYLILGAKTVTSKNLQIHYNTWNPVCIKLSGCQEQPLKNVCIKFEYMLVHQSVDDLQGSS